MTKSEMLKYYGNRPLITIGSTVIEEVFKHDSPGYIEEGLIKTYPIDRVVNMMSEIFGMKIISGKLDDVDKKLRKIIFSEDDDYSNGIICKATGVPNDESERIIFIVGDGTYNKEMIDSHMNKYGYFLSMEDYYMYDMIKLVYEKKFDCDVNDIVKQKKYIYHICPSKLKDKIKIQGITPHLSKWQSFKNDKRCYFFTELDIDLAKEWANNFNNGKVEDTNYMLLGINVEKLSEDIKFYLDPRMKNGVYTLEGISPNAIEVLNTEL